MAYDDLGEPRSRVEGYLDNIAGGEHDMGEPRSRVEAYLERIAEGGGGADLSDVGLVLSGATITQVRDGSGSDSVTLPSATTEADGLMTAAQASALAGKLDASQKGAAGGVASLDQSGKVPASQLPSYVDDVVEVASYAALPQVGEAGKIYVTLDDGKCWRWGGSAYAEVASGGVTYTLTKSGSTVTLTGSDGSTSAVPDADTTYAEATTSAAGLMSATDKAKLDGLGDPPEANWAVYSTDDRSLTFLHLDEAPVAGTTTIRNYNDTRDLVVRAAYPAENSGSGWAESNLTTNTRPWSGLATSLMRLVFRDRMPDLPLYSRGGKQLVTAPMAYWFANCTSLIDVYGLESCGITAIGYYAFYWCTSLSHISLPDSLREVGGYAFCNCTWLTLSDLPDSLQLVDPGAFAKTGLSVSRLPSAMVSLNSGFDDNASPPVGFGPFQECSQITELTIPENVNLVDAHAFKDCAGLRRVVFDGIPSKGRMGETGYPAFANDTSIEHIYVPWSEGAIALAPWGATNATIHYGYHAVMSTELASASANGLMSASDYSKLAAMPPVEVVSALPASPAAGTLYVVADGTTTTVHYEPVT